MRKGIEHQEIAKHHAQAADTIERQLDTSIYNDDTDRDARLREKLEGLEAERDRMKAINKWLRANMKRFNVSSLDVYKIASKNGAPELFMEAKKVLKINTKEMQDLLSSFQHSMKIGYPSYALTNLSGNISRTRKRLGGSK